MMTLTSCHWRLVLLPLLLGGCLQSTAPRPAEPPPQVVAVPPQANPEEAEPQRIELSAETLAALRESSPAQPPGKSQPKTARMPSPPPAIPVAALAPEKVDVATPQAPLPPRQRAAPLPEQSPAASKALAWLQFCATVYDAGNAIRCDTNSLLAQPSAKVQVYVREPALARNTPGGPIRLREGLPSLYRIFVLR